MPPLVLIVDDEPDIVEILVAVLEGDGYRTATARDGQAALDAIVRVRPDVIVSDIKMPRLHGLALIERVRARGDETPVVLVSGSPAPAAIPGVWFIAKPFELDTVSTVVRESLATRWDRGTTADAPSAQAP